MTLSLEQLKAAFKKNDSELTNRPNNYYPFWDIPDGQSAVVRFLPDTNPDNALGFLVEKLMHTLTINGEKKSIPCLKMYGEDCPICKVSSAYYKDDDKENGKKFWRKKQHIAQALIIEDPLPANETTGETHEGKVRFLALGYQLFNVIKEAFEGGELDDVPFSPTGGYDFIIKKSKQGEYSTYAVGSRFRAKARALTKHELEIVEHGSVDLSTLIPQHPGVEKVQAMLEAALTGGSYTEEATPRLTSKSTKAVTHRADDDSNDEEDFSHYKTESKVSSPAKQVTVETSSEFEDEADAILANIRNRKTKRAE